MADFVEKSYFCTHHISSKRKEIIMPHIYFARHGQTVWNVENKICGSKREAREFFAQGSITCNGEKISDENTPVTKAMAIEEKVIVVRRGKKKNYILKF